MDIAPHCPRSTPDELKSEPMDLRVYAWLVRNQRAGTHDPETIARELPADLADVRHALSRLIETGLLAEEPLPGSRLTVVPAEAAASRRTAPLEAQIRERQEAIAHIRSSVDPFSLVFQRESRSWGGGFQEISTVAEVRDRLNRLSDDCRTELVSCQPGGGSRVPAAMAEAMGRDRAMLDRGVRIRTLYHHTARFNGPSQAYVAELSTRGAEYRTLHELFGRLIIVDRETAFIPAPGHDGQGAILISEPPVVAYLYDIFELAWTHARPFVDATGRAMEAVSRELHRTILRLLADGLKDEAIARRLGMSLRTTRRHVADILSELNVSSRFQAGVAAARSGLLEEVDGHANP